MSATVTMRVDQDRWPAIVRRYERLVQTHRQLEDRIERESVGPAVDPFSMQEMNRRKLRAKDSIAAIERLIDRAGSEGMLKARTL